MLLMIFEICSNDIFGELALIYFFLSFRKRKYGESGSWGFTLGSNFFSGFFSCYLSLLVLRLALLWSWFPSLLSFFLSCSFSFLLYIFSLFFCSIYYKRFFSSIYPKAMALLFLSCLTLSRYLYVRDFTSWKATWSRLETLNI